MPLYEFHCQKCQKDFELLVKSSRSEGASCPHCGSKKLMKKFSTFAASVAQSPSSAMPDPCPMKTSGACGCCGPTHRH